MTHNNEEKIGNLFPPKTKNEKERFNYGFAKLNNLIARIGTNIAKFTSENAVSMHELQKIQKLRHK